MAVETMETENSSDLIGGGILTITILVLAFASAIPSQLVDYILAGIGILSILMLVYRLRKLPYEQPTYIGYILIVFSFLLIVSTFLGALKPRGIYFWIGGAGIIVGLIIKILLLDLFISDMIKKLFSAIALFWRSPHLAFLYLSMVLQLITVLFVYENSIFELVFITTTIIAIPLSGTFHKSIQLKKFFAAIVFTTIIIGILTLPAGEGIPSFILIYLVIAPLIFMNPREWRYVGRLLATVRSYLKQLVTNWEFLSVLFGTIGITTVLDLSFNYGEPARLLVFIASSALVGFGIRKILAPIYGTIITLFTNITDALVSNFNLDNVLTASGIIILTIDIMYPLRVDLLQRIGIGVFALFLIYLSEKRNRRRFKRYIQSLLNSESGLYFFTGLGVLIFNYMYFQGTPYFIGGLVLGIFSLSLSIKIFRRIVFSLARVWWNFGTKLLSLAYNNFIYLTAWIISLGLEFWGIILLFSGDTENALTAPFSNLSGPARIAVAGGLVLLGIVLFKETYSKNKSRGQRR